MGTMLIEDESLSGSTIVSVLWTPEDAVLRSYGIIRKGWTESLDIHFSDLSSSLEWEGDDRRKQ